MVDDLDQLVGAGLDADGLLAGGGPLRRCRRPGPPAGRPGSGRALCRRHVTVRLAENWNVFSLPPGAHRPR